MSEAFLVVSVIGALFTLNAFRPPRIRVLSIPVFFASWLTSELPIHHLMWQVVATGFFIAFGALKGTAGQIGLAITALSWIGLVVLAIQASRADQVLEPALESGMGTTLRPAESGDRVVEWSRLVLPFRMRDPDVEVVRDIAYDPDGSRAHRLDIYRNRARPSGAPVLVYIHGGGWVIGDKREQGLPMMLHLAAHGWVCVTANYRLSPKARFPDHLIDCKQALEWVKANIAVYGGDPSFIAVSGGSAGGHLASLLALAPEPETDVAACVSLYGVYDFTDRDGLWGKGFRRFLERRVMPVRWADDPAAYSAASPMDQISSNAPPFMVVHGSNDRLVPVEEARTFARLLRATSKAPVVYAELPGAQHAFEIFRSIRTAHLVRAVEQFLSSVRQNHPSARV
jgi:acetyl esterase/lipase